VFSAGYPGQNLYPAPDNYPSLTFPQPVPPPDGEPDDPDTLMQVEYSWIWQPVLLAAVDQLLNPATWQGTHDEIITALNRATGLKDQLQIPVFTQDVPPPYWDDVSDVETTDPPGDQIWYGQYVDSTFQETLENWAIAGFIALSGAPQAAIVFLTVAPKFRLAFKAHDLGGIVRIFIDAVDYGTVDTASDTDAIITYDIVADPDTSPHEILLVKDDE